MNCHHHQSIQNVHQSYLPNYCT